MSSALEKHLSQLHRQLELQGQTLALAESCTGGMASARLAERAGVSSVFLGSVISYHREVKHKILKVPTSLLQVMGEVSIPVAEQMAIGVRHELGSDWAAAITGVAGPTGGSVEKPVGTVAFAVVGPGYKHSEIKYFGEKHSRLEIQNFSVEHVFALLYSAICPNGRTK